MIACHFDEVFISINQSINQSLFKHGKSSVKLAKKKVKKNALTLFYMIAVWESDMSEIRFEIFRLKSPIESVSLISWGRLFHRRAPL